MKTQALKSFVKVMLAAVILMTNAAFKKGDTIQLGKNLNGRTSLNFRKSARNISQNIPLVKAGTIASVMDYRRLKSGNYGVKIRLDGPEYASKPETERTVWIYDWKNRDDDVKACADSGCIEEAKSMESAGWAQAKRDQAGSFDVPEPIVVEGQRLSKEETAPADTAGQNGCAWGCTASEAPSAPAQVRQIVQTLPTAREDYDEEMQAASEDVMPSEEGAHPIADLTFTGGATLPKACHKIIDNQGNIGPYGRMLIEAMNKPQYQTQITNEKGQTETNSVFLRGNVMTNLCPRYSRMNESQKYTALLVMWAALANKEGSCSTVNDHMALQRAYGLFSAEKSAATRAIRGRACAGDITNVSVQISCAVDTVAVFGNQGLLDGRHLTQSGYFEPLQDWNKRSVYSRKHRKHLKFTPVVDYVQRIAQCR